MDIRRFSRLLGAAIVTAVPVWPATVAAQDALADDHPKYRAARAVYDDLVRAIGDGRTPPAFRLLQGRGAGMSEIAWYQAESHTVTVEERVYDALKALGPNTLDALAFLLGHELAHAYQDHGWAGPFGQSYRATQVAGELRQAAGSEAARIRAETEADFFGGLFGYLAGYNTLGIAPRALEIIYEAYGFPDRLEGYASLADRQEIARITQARLARLVPVFDAANLLLVVGAHSEAAAAFEYLARTFPSREILNNAGVARALAAIELMDPRQVRFVYPLELDPITRLERRTRGTGESDRSARLLAEAARLFQQALQRDTSYVVALLNSAVVDDLRGESEVALARAGSVLRHASSQGDSTLAGYARMVRGIALARLGEPDEARLSLRSAASQAALLARLNLALLEGSDPRAAAAATRTTAPGTARETIPGGGFPVRASSGAAERSIEVAMAGGGVLFVRVRQAEQWQELVVNADEQVVSFLSTSPRYEGRTAQGIRIGDPMERVAAAYGHAATLQATPQGMLHVYRRPAIIFEADSSGAVDGWTLYDVRPRGRGG